MSACLEFYQAPYRHRQKASAHNKIEKLRGLNQKRGEEKANKREVLVWEPAEGSNGARSGGLRSQHG
jgi:hypothetical protein